MTVLHDNVNGRDGLDRVSGEAGIVENGSSHLTPNAVIIERCRKYFNLVIHPFHTFQVLDSLLSGVFNDCIADLTDEGDGAAVNAVSQIVKDSELRDHRKLMTDLASKPLLFWMRA